MAHMMMLLGRYQRLILDSWTRPKYQRVSGRPRITDTGIERAFRRYRQFAGSRAAQRLSGSRRPDTRVSVGSQLEALRSFAFKPASRAG